jgi:hypothetical protein
MSPTESISSEQSSNVTTPSNPINTSKTIQFNFIYRISLIFSLELAEQFQVYDNDDGRSSRAYQNMNDEECFNQLCNELYSQCKYKFYFKNYFFFCI